MKKLFKSIANRQILFYVGRYTGTDPKELQALLENELHSKSFIDQTLELQHLRQTDPAAFENLVRTYEDNVQKSKLRRFTATLRSIQKLVGENCKLLFDGQPTTIPDMASHLLASFYNTHGTTNPYTIGDYRILLTVQRPDPHKIRHTIQLLGPKGLVTTFTNSEYIGRVSSLLSEHFNLSDRYFTGLLQNLGAGLVATIPTSDAKPTIFGCILKDASTKEGKAVPADLPYEKKVLIQEYINNGDMLAVKRILRRQYRDQKHSLLDIGQKALHAAMASYAKECRKIRDLKNSRISIIEKVQNEQVTKGCRMQYIPLDTEVSPAKDRKVFVAFYDDMYHPKALLIPQILSKAGWGGSLLIMTHKNSTLRDLLTTDQVDFVIQGKLGLNNDKDLYTSELAGQFPGYEKWENSILPCFITNESELDAFIEKFKPEELLHQPAA